MFHGILLLCISLATSLKAAAKVDASTALQPNFVLILMDDMGWADGGCFGSRYYQTPNLDKLAKGGMRFTQAYASCAVCSPTRAALQTGKSPARLHITDWIPGEGSPKDSNYSLPDWQKHLPLEEFTIAEALRKIGYATAHIGKWHLGGTNNYPEYQGYDVSIAGGHIGHPASYFWPYGQSNTAYRVPGLAERAGKPGDYLTDQLTDEAVAFIEANRGKRFFLQLSHYAVHAPLMAKTELIRQAGERTGANGQSNAVYAAMLRSVDESVGRILDRLKALRLDGKTMVIFTSDNGGAVHFGNPPATSNAPLRSGKGFAYEGGLRVPLLVRAPWMVRARSVCDTPVISTDFFPTLVELAGGQQPTAGAGVDGVSLVPVLKGRKDWKRDALFWHYPHYWNGGRVSPYSVARVGNFKLIRFYETGREELYDLQNDTGEQHNLAQTSMWASRRSEISSRLDAWLKETGAQMPVAKKHKS